MSLLPVAFPCSSAWASCIKFRLRGIQVASKCFQSHQKCRIVSQHIDYPRSFGSLPKEWTGRSWDCLLLCLLISFLGQKLRLLACGLLPKLLRIFLLLASYRGWSLTDKVPCFFVLVLPQFQWYTWKKERQQQYDVLSSREKHLDQLAYQWLFEKPFSWTKWAE